MEQHVRPLASAQVLLVLLLVGALTVSSVWADDPLEGTCLLSGQECQNSTYSTATGVPTVVLTQSTCEDPSVGGYWDDTDSVLDVPLCAPGCCCTADPLTQGGVTIALACAPSDVFVQNIADATCKTTCEDVQTPTQPACGTGPVTQADIAANCVCGTQTPTTAGEYCCSSGVLAADQASCDAQLPNCELDEVATESCLCGSGTAAVGEVCCTGGAITNSTASCLAAVPGAGVCGNNVLEGNEECDARYYWDYTQNPPNFVYSAGSACANAGEICTAQCTCLTPPGTNACGNGVCDANENSQVCPSDCPLPPSCPGGYGAPINAAGSYDESVPSNPQVALAWGLNSNQCVAALLGITVSRSTVSEDAAENNPEYISTLLPKTATTHRDSLPVTLSSGTVYYAITAVYQAAGGGTTTASTTLTVHLPNADCPTANAAYCKDANTPVTCTNYVPDVDSCRVGGSQLYTCRVSSTQGQPIASCIPQTSECKYCNGVFESFANDDWYIHETHPDGSGSNLKCSATSTCFKDLRQTSVEQYLMCSQIQSCAGYRSQDACERNMCTKPSTPTGGACEWVAISNDLSSGVCRPSDPTFQDCSSCNELGGACNSVTCSLLTSDDSCYYHTPFSGQIHERTSGEPAQCMDKDDVLCEYLPTQDLCEGVPPQRTTYNLNVTYANSERQGGDHSIVTPSNDVLGRGKCVWFTDTYRNMQYCAKDSDDDGLADKWTYAPGVNFNTLLNDFRSPDTTVLGIPGGAYPREFTVFMAGNETFYNRFCRKDQQNCYPLANTTRFDAGYVSRTFSVDESGEWVLRYYGFDESNNLEVVKEFPFTVDVLPPVITVGNITYTPYYQNPTSIKTSVYAPFTTNEDAYCRTKLLSDNRTTQQPVGPLLSGATELGDPPATEPPFGTSFSITYPQLSDGRYFLNITCTDKTGNKNEYPVSAPIIVDSDPRIHGPSPVSNVPQNNNSVDLRIQTNSSATCRYAPRTAQQPSFNSMTPYDTTGGTTHTATISVSTGTYEFLTACNMSNQIVYGTAPQDDIKFLIDQEPPRTLVCNANLTGNTSSCVLAQFGSSNPQQSYRVTLRCADDPTTPASGCDYRDDIFMCTYKPPTQTSCTPIREFSVPQIVGPGITRIVYYSRDNAGNQESQQEISVQPSDLTAPSYPYFTVSG